MKTFLYTHSLFHTHETTPTFPPSLSLSLQKLYLTFVRNARFTSLSSLPRISLMKSCVVEIISLDVATGYQHGFVYIRQLALHLRSAITSGKKEAIQVVQTSAIMLIFCSYAI